MRFDQSPKWAFEKLDAGNAEELVLKSMALEAEEFFDENEEVIDQIQIEFWWSAVLAWAQAVFWIATILIGGY